MPDAEKDAATVGNWWCSECVVWHPKDMGASAAAAHAEWQRRTAECDGHYGAGTLREWDECPVCNPPRVLPPAEKGQADA